MGEWKISPNDGVTNPNDGTFVLPASDVNITYSITYVDGSCSSNTISYLYVASACSCSDLSVTSSTVAFDATGSTSTVGSVTAGCSAARDTSSTVDWVTVTTDGTSVKVSADANNTGADRNGTLYLSVGENQCSTAITVSQPAQAADCPDESDVVIQVYTAPQTGGTIDNMVFFDKENAAFASAKTLSCDGTIITAVEWGTSTYQDGKKSLKLTFSENTTSIRRDGTVTVTMATTGTNDCVYSITVDQYGLDPCPASGDVITGDREVPGCANSYSGHLQFKTGDTAFTSDVSIVGDGTVVIGGFLDNNTEPGYRMVIITTSENPSTSEARNGSITITVGANGGGTCTYTVPITQKKRDSSYCQTLSSATIRYTNNTGTQIQDGIGYLYDSSGNEIGEFRIDSLIAGNSLDYPIGGNSLGKTVAKVIAKMHLVGSGGDLVCRNCLGSGIISERLEAGHTYAVNIGNDIC